MLVVARDSEGTAQAFDMTDATGSFALTGLADGRVTLSADRVRFGRQTESVDAGSGVTPIFTLSASTATSADETPDAAAADLRAVPEPGDGPRDGRVLARHATEARVALYDVLGREVMVAADGRRAAGPQTVDLDVSGLPAGLYVVRIVAGGSAEARTLTVVR